MVSEKIGVLLLRIVLGTTFMIHGFAKFQGGIENTVGFFQSVGLPGFAAYVVALIELIGGIAIILGLGTRIVARLFAIIMIGAIFTVKLSAGFLGGETAGYELDLLLLVLSFYFVTRKPVDLSLDHMLFSNKGVRSDVS
ncbi:DoxX family protein [Alkalihalobacillus sp. CinArs1]|uniref:DoxX family protein n=1 Tax=Alkalihalobacillus sp. CinArs1 TaxID=2995314 RepID=UPI0022DD6BAF|nr:DoxX family protein [Alkalihalobacillus sp. CinArs1]